MILTNYYFLKDLYKHIPRQRRLPEALKTQASAMLAMNSNSASVTATIASCTHTTSDSKTDVTIVPASTTHSATTEDTHIIPTAIFSFNSTPTCTATTTMPSNDAKCPRLADKSDETAISLGKSHHHKQFFLLCM